MNSDVQSVESQWNNTAVDYGSLLAIYKQYSEKLDDLEKIQKDCSVRVKNYLKALLDVKKSAQKLSKCKTLSAEERQRLSSLNIELTQRLNWLSDVQDHLPKSDKGLYLNIILGPMNCSIVNKKDRFQYKDDYEKFKLRVQVIALVSSILALLFRYRAMDAICNFLLVWYYCTLTIREAILHVNGSRIQGWWVLKHYVSTVLCGVAITWPDGICYQLFRRQLLMHIMYLSFVQVLQTQYQRGCLYRLRALGEGHSMHITMEGFHSWMWKGLSFLLPFLITGHLYQAYNSYVLYQLWRMEKTAEWQVFALSGLFLVMFLGNFVTTFMVVLQKLLGKTDKDRLKTKYTENDQDLQKDK